MDVLQATLKKETFALDMGDFHATKHASSAASSIVHHQKPNKLNINFPPTPIDSSQKCEGCIEAKISNLKKLFN